MGFIQDENRSGIIKGYCESLRFSVKTLDHGVLQT